MKVKAKISMLLELDAEEFPMPVDGDPTEELEEMLEELVDHLDGTRLVRLNIKCTGGQIHD
jgi:hypothetical protein|tara:strand:- start:1664 stop:1846 length:183 start_codon:yes stop_codon:yes gene_type:complete